MSKQIRNLGAFFMVCYLALFIQMNRLAVFDGEDLREDPLNRRELRRDFGAPRGTIVTEDGEIVAQSVPTDTEWGLQRVFPQGELYSHITGYYSLHVGSTGLEHEYNADLAGRTLDAGLDPEAWVDYLTDDDQVGNLTLTLRHDLQQQAREQLGDRPGSVVVLDPRSGAILAMYSNPTYDPNIVSAHDFEEANEAYNVLNTAEGNPLLGRTYQDRFFPGSTFKVVTAAAGLESGEVNQDTTYPSEQCYQPPRGGDNCISNYGDNSCGGDFFEILARSCNTSFMQMAVEQTGANQMVRTAEGFGFNTEMPIDLPNAAPSHFPSTNEFEFAEPKLALSSIGQDEVQASPLEMALVAAAVANEGDVPTPHVVAEIRDKEDRLVHTNEPGTWRTAIPDSSDVDTLYDAMVNVVADGTADGLQLDGYEVGGKTGTAQLDDSRTSSHAWIIGFAGPEGEEPTVATAVLIEAQEGASENTGGTVAAPIARELMQTALEPPAQPDS
jgi:peptidoglycan glycosyltransferase